MRVKTIQASSIKSVFEVLKDIINDVNVYFTAEGIKILTLDTARVTLVQMNLLAENFEEYDCPEEIIAGLNMANVHKLLKSVTSSDTLTISAEGRDIMEFTIENQDKNSITHFKLKLLDINEDMIEFPDIEMNVITTMQSIDFQRFVRDMSNLGNEMMIWREGTELELSCSGDFAEQKTIIRYPDVPPCDRTGGAFSLKYISLYTKATNMCSSIQFMQNSKNVDMPIIFRYTIANLGDLKFFLAPNISP